MADRRFSRYLAVFVLTMVAAVGCVWLYVAVLPIAFMESGYAAWRAKSDMLDRCDLGDVAFFGDSRLEASVMPTELGVEARNFALPAATVLETSVAVERALRCPNAPKQAVISISGEHFGPVSKYFWYLTVRYGFLSASDLGALETQAQHLGDDETFATRTADGLSGWTRDWLYFLRFPSLSFASLVKGRVFGRYGSNVVRTREVLRDQGWSPYLVAEPEAAPPLDHFQTTRLQDARFGELVRALQQRGIQVLVLATPFRDHHRESAAYLADYRAYLALALAKHPGLALLGQFVTYPDRYFIDSDHLAPEGAKQFSERLAACIGDGRLRTDCDLSLPDRQSAVLEVQ